MESGAYYGAVMVGICWCPVINLRTNMCTRMMAGSAQRSSCNFAGFDVYDQVHCPLQSPPHCSEVLGPDGQMEVRGQV